MARRSDRSTREQRDAERRRAEKAHAAWVAREQKVDDQLRRQQEREDRQAYLQAQRDLAEERTAAAETRVRALTAVLSDTLDRPPLPPDFAAMKTQLKLPVLDLGSDTNPIPTPQWNPPRPPSAVGRFLGRQGKYEQEKELAEARFANALDEHGHAESARQRRVADRRQAHDQAVEQARH